MAARVVLIRHGETEWSQQRRHTGRTDLPLNAEGKRRARQLSSFFTTFPDAAKATVLTSPLLRARQTCELAGLCDEATVDEDLVEWDYGEFEGTETSVIRETDPDWSIWTATIERGESLDDVGRRADRVLARVESIGGTVVLFAHAHFLRIFAARWCECPPEAGRRLTLLPASVSVLGYERDVRVIEQWNLNTDAPPGMADHGYAGMGNER